MRYVSLVKPGIIFGNLITFCGGYFLTKAVFNPIHFLCALLGMALVIACGCTLNNYIDRDIDRLMDRTKNRPCAQDKVSLAQVMTYATLLGLCGLTLLGLKCGWVVSGVALVGLVVYVGLYSLYLKRHSVLGTFIGGISGAIPPVVGYMAVYPHFNTATLILFVILFLWQIPHSYAIGIYRLSDYQAANIPVMPVIHGIPLTRWVMLVFVILFCLTTPLLYIFHYAPLSYLIISCLLNIFWLIQTLSFLWKKDTNLWARKTFLYSIINITGLSLSMAFF